MKIFSYCSTAVLALSFLCSSLGCSNQHNSTAPVSNTSAFARTLERAKKDKRYMVMHSGVDFYAIREVEVEKSKQAFTVHLNLVDSIHKANINNPKQLGEKHLHVYMRDSTSYTLDEPHTIPLNKVARIEKVD